uniref:Cytochrome P450 n=1 Tax=Compsopogon caeruleus TaxID=31354 RepID=A0A7S1XC49_9RHOD|mmetsp:Transcript_12599/g.25571  ORF Transcript_12599/g.25571 Transcript_12599/m.25571 type:complete len:493 (+) Transcript_12599:9-1487(+)
MGDAGWKWVTLAVAGVSTVGLATSCWSLMKMARTRAQLRKAKDGSVADGPCPLPVLGNVWELNAEGYYETLVKYRESPAPVFWVCTSPFLVLTTEESVRRVLEGSSNRYAKPRYFGYRSRAVQSAVETHKHAVAAKETVENSDGGPLDSSRKALLQLVADSIPTIREGVSKMISRLAQPSSSRDELMIIQEEVVVLALDILFGYRDREVAIRTARQIAFSGEEFARRMINPFRAWMYGWTSIRFIVNVFGLIGLGRRLCRSLDRASSEGKQTWVHGWIGKVGRIGKLGKVVGLMMAATQTVPLTAVWMLLLVGSDPIVMDSLRREIKEVLGGKALEHATLEDYDRMKFTDYVIKETLRLYPPFPLLQREAQVDDVIGGLKIPQGTAVYVVPWMIHHSPTIWKNPDLFYPERWIINEYHADSPSDYAYIPFGRGPRMCAGSRLAMMELKILLLSICYNFDIIPHSPLDTTALPDMDMKPRNHPFSLIPIGSRQ